MLLQSFPYPPITKTLTAADSVNLRINLLQLKVDSLEKIVLKTEIGTGFFSDVISTNLYMFATIIGLGSFISWAFIGKMLVAHKKSVANNAGTMIRNHTEKYDVSLNEIRDKLLDTIYDASVSMYFNAIENGTETTQFRWSMTTLSAHLNVKRASPETRLFLIENSVGHLKKIEVGDKTTKENLKIYQDILDRLDLLGDAGISLIAQNMREDILNICHSKPTVIRDTVNEDAP
jgi:hypothetical protein